MVNETPAMARTRVIGVLKDRVKRLDKALAMDPLPPDVFIAEVASSIQDAAAAVFGALAFSRQLRAARQAHSICVNCGAGLSEIDDEYCSACLDQAAAAVEAMEL